MSIRSQWCEFDKETRKYIKKRDKEQCVICGNKGALQIMHIFVNRSHGGKGCKENGCLGCIKCHKILDNPIGAEQNELSKEYMNKCKNYLIEKEHLVIDKSFLDMLYYKKEIGKIEFDPSPKIVEYKIRCKHCKHLVKTKGNNTTIPSYYCKIRKILINKSTEACKYFKK